MAPTGGRLQWNEREYDRLFNSEDGPVGRDLNRRGEIGTQTAKRLCPTSPRGSDGRGSGYTRSNIGHALGRDERGLYVDVKSTARTRDGIPISLLLEFGTRAHIITSHGDYPLRNRQTGQVFGRSVRHPGTEAQPHLRPALVEMVRS
ncbi:hypothetical protein [Actinomadura sp. GTD37]|uniref:hypothetical protein n=1 Tax=Actinomadura sp. GTD37 TaxID=1778030 RepID=UPI0035C1ED79